MNTRHIAALLLMCLPWLTRDAYGAKPNVLIFCVDDLKPLLGCYPDFRYWGGGGGSGRGILLGF